ncbi:MAG: DUF1501 domain-containing protein [Persicimonas sp.]
MSRQNDDPYAECDPDDQPEGTGTDRRTFLKGVGIAAAGLTMPHVWTPRRALASTIARDTVKHLLYIRLAGGFRFTAAFNGEVTDEFNPFGTAEGVPGGTEWGVGKLLERAPYLEGDGADRRRELGMRPVHEIADQIAVIPCVDHEPLAGRADGNHGTGLERFNKGRVSSGTSFFTMINYGLRERYETAREDGKTLLPAFSVNDSGMALGAGRYAGYRPPVLRDDSFASFGFEASEHLPEWAQQMADSSDERFYERIDERDREPLDAYQQTRSATREYNEIFTDDMLRVGEASEEPYDGISNEELQLIFGDGPAASRIRLALRLFHFGCPAVFLNQGGYDYHSGEENRLPDTIVEMNRIISGLEVALKTMEHPDGGSYWDHTLVVLGSEFGRTAGGNEFNSARGSDHGGDLATRWMSMPFMGGVIDEAGNGGRRFGETRNRDLEATGQVYSYRSVLKTLMDVLGCDHREFFDADDPFDDLFA